MAEELILNEKHSDTTLKVRYGGYSWRFPGHSLLLNARSPVMRDILEFRCAEAHDSPVTIVGMTSKTALDILNYIYTGTIPVDVSVNLLVTAEKYKLEDLREKLEESFLPHMTISQACEILDGLEHEQPHKDECPVKKLCLNLIEKHAYRVFASDLVLNLSQKTLHKLLESNKLNVPDEKYIFWGLWRWGVCNSSRLGRTLEEKNISLYIADLLKHIRHIGFSSKDGIPQAAIDKFNKCAGRRTKFYPPDDSLDLCDSIRTCNFWEEILEVCDQRRHLCLQFSANKDIMLVGISFEFCSSKALKGYVQIFEESSGDEFFRQEMNCGQISGRKLCRTGEPESWAESDVVLSEPLILQRSPQIYSIYFQPDPRGTNAPWALPRASIQTQNNNNRKRRIDSTFVKFHGQYVLAVRDLYLVPDMTVSWGPRM